MATEVQTTALETIKASALIEATSISNSNYVVITDGSVSKKAKATLFKGDTGVNGKSIELQKTSTHIQWRQEGGEWTNLVALSDITGPAGSGSDVDLSSYATQSWVLEQIANVSGGGSVDLSSYALKSELHNHSNKAELDKIVEGDKAKWDAKSNFSGSYNDLTDKPNSLPANGGNSDTVDGYHFQVLTQAEYDALPEKDTDTFYAISDASEGSGLTEEQATKLNSIGDVANLTTTNKSNLVAAVNENKSSLEDIKTRVNILENSDSTGAILEITGKKILAYGDSITSNGQYLNYAVQKLGIVLTNQGISNTTMTPSSNPVSNGDLFSKFNNTCPDLSSYDVITIAHATNDLSSNIPIGTIGTIGQDSFDTNTFYGAYRHVIETITKNYPNIRIMLCTPIHKRVANEPSDINANSAGHKLKDYVDSIRNIAEMYSLQVCDFYRDCGINYYNYASFMPDGVHPNDAGGILMGKTYVENLKKLGFAQGTVTESVKVTGVTISSKNIEVNVNSNFKLSATVKPSDATNKYLTWSSDKNNIAVVDNGLIKGISEGSCVVTVETQDGGYTDSCNVIVNPQEVIGGDLTTNVGVYNGYINSTSGAYVEGDGSKCTGFIDITDATDVVAKIKNTTLTTNWMVFYDENKTFISTGENKFTEELYNIVPSNAKYCRLSGNKIGMTGFEIYILGTTEEANNIADLTDIVADKYYDLSNGELKSQNDMNTTKPIGVENSNYYIIDGVGTGAVFSSNVTNTSTYVHAINFVSPLGKRRQLYVQPEGTHARLNIGDSNLNSVKMCKMKKLGYLTVSQ